MAAARVTGMVLSADRRTGTAKASGNPYDFTEVTALVGGRDLMRFTVQGTAGAGFTRGDLVDVLVDVDVYNGRLQASLVSEWPQDEVVLDALAGVFQAG